MNAVLMIPEVDTSSLRSLEVLRQVRVLSRD